MSLGLVTGTFTLRVFLLAPPAPLLTLHFAMGVKET